MTEMPLWPGLEPPETPAPAQPGPTPPPPPPATDPQPGSRGGSQPGGQEIQQPHEDDDEWLRPILSKPVQHPAPTLYQSTPPQGVGGAPATPPRATAQPRGGGAAGPRSSTPENAARAGAPVAQQAATPLAPPPQRGRPAQGHVYGHAPAQPPASPRTQPPRAQPPAPPRTQPPVSPAPAERPGAPASASPYGWKAQPAAEPGLVVTRTSPPKSTNRSPQAPARPTPGQPAPAEHAGVYGSAATRKAGLAVAALIFAFLVPPLGIVLGHVARRRSRKGIAATALFFAYVLTLAAVAATVLWYQKKI